MKKHHLILVNQHQLIMKQSFQVASQTVCKMSGPSSPSPGLASSQRPSGLPRAGWLSGAFPGGCYAAAGGEIGPQILNNLTNKIYNFLGGHGKHTLYTEMFGLHPKVQLQDGSTACTPLYCTIIYCCTMFYLFIYCKLFINLSFHLFSISLCQCFIGSQWFGPLCRRRL